MDNTADLKENCKEKANQNDDALNSCRGDLCSTQIMAPKSYGGVNELLPDFDIASLGDSGGKSILSKVGDCAAKAAGATKDFVVDTTKTIANIPKEDWLDMADAAKEVAKKDGTTLAVDVGLVVGSKGTNILADGKLALDVYQTVTSEEGQRLGREIKEAWNNGEKNKVA